MKEYRENSPTKASENPYSQGSHKQKKVLVISLSNTVINPGTVVIKALRRGERVGEGRKERERGGGGKGRDREMEARK